MSGNWIVQNIQNALDTWNSKLGEIWTLITQTPATFKGGAIWNVIKNIYGAMQGIGLALLVLFFVVGMMKTCGSLTEVKKPEHALKLFIRFAIAKTVVTYEYPADYTEGMEKYYPVNDEKNNELANKYRELSQKENNVIFGGRLAEYKYYDMDDVIKSAINIYGSVK